MCTVTLSGKGKAFCYVSDRRYGGQQFFLDVDARSLLCLRSYSTTQHRNHRDSQLHTCSIMRLNTCSIMRS